MVRKAGFVLLALGLAALAWVGVVLAWGDPFTSLYTRHQQHELSRRLDAVDDRWGPARDGAAAAAAALATASSRARAAAFAETLRDGDPIGRIVVPRLGLRMVVVQGTTATDLEKGPGHYDRRSGQATRLPGQGGIVAIAGHRTTYLHPFRHIDDLRPGDAIELEMPYGTFRYRVTGHRVVASTDWSILRPRRVETVVLTACHPLYSASHRWAVFARLVAGPV